MAVGIRVGNGRRNQGCPAQVLEPGHRLILPGAVVLPNVMGWLAVDDQDVEIAVAVEIGECGLPSPSLAHEAHLGRQRAERPVGIVAVELGAAWPGDQDIEVGIVVCIRDGPGAARRGAEHLHVRPGTVGLLS